MTVNDPTYYGEEGHLPATCDQCADDRRKAGDEWRLDRADEMRRVS
jgi:hypothetical protein